MSAVWIRPGDSVDFEYNQHAFAAGVQSIPGVSGWREILLSQPGVVIEFDSAQQLPAGLCVATAAIASLLFDRDTRVWLSASADCKVVRAYLRRHTQSLQVTEPSLADFAIITRPGERAPLGNFFCGTDQCPDRSTTLIVQVDRIECDGPWSLTGPGLREAQRLGVSGLGESFLLDWARNAGLHPRGVDVILTSGSRCCFLPRTTRIGIAPASSR
jgi:alpha-D-ribose 1-methylphosphonate 5-triphosphate synthase subunit PhnH